MKMKIPSITSYKLLIVGFYAAICQALAILLYYNTNPDGLSPLMLSRYAADMLEYTLMTATIFSVGALLLEIIKRDTEKA